MYKRQWILGYKMVVLNKGCRFYPVCDLTTFSIISQIGLIQV